MPIESDSMLERLRTQLQVLQAWVRDLSAENAALRERLSLQEPQTDRTRETHRPREAA